MGLDSPRRTKQDGVHRRVRECHQRQARMPWQGIVKFYKGSISVIITETQFAIQTKGQFVPIAVGSLNGDMVVRAAFGSYVDPAYQRQWVVENIASIRNQHLDKEYRARSQEMLLQRNQFRSRMAPANDSLMFSCVRTDEELQKIADDGYCVRSTSSNYLGDGMKGVTLSCHADVHLKVAQLVVTHTCWMIISKGRHGGFSTSICSYLQHPPQSLQRLRRMHYRLGNVEVIVRYFQTTVFPVGFDAESIKHER